MILIIQVKILIATIQKNWNRYLIKTNMKVGESSILILNKSFQIVNAKYGHLFSGESLVYEVANFLNENNFFYEVYTASTTGTVTIEHNLGALPDVIGVFCFSNLTSAGTSRPQGTSSTSSYSNYADAQLLSAKAEKDLEGNYSSSTLYARPMYYYNAGKKIGYHVENVSFIAPTSTSTTRISNITETSFSVPYLDSGKEYGIFAFIRSN